MIIPEPRSVHDPLVRSQGRHRRPLRRAIVHIGRPRKDRPDRPAHLGLFVAEGISPATGPGAELGSRSMEPETPAPRKRATPAAKRSAAPRTTAKATSEKPVKARARKREFWQTGLMPG